MTHTSLWGRESTVQKAKGHCLSPLSFHSHPLNLSYHFLLLLLSQKWHLLSILGPVAQIYVDVSNENSTTSPNICRTAVRPFSLSLSLLHLLLSHFPILFPLFSSFILFFFIIDLFFQSPSLGRCGFHTWCEMLFLQRLLTHVCKIFSLGGIWDWGQYKLACLCILHLHV